VTITVNLGGTELSGLDRMLAQSNIFSKSGNVLLTVNLH
jgi:hypothetical protein